MARWVRVDASPDDDVRVNLIIRASKDPAIHKALSRLEHRGGPAQALRTILEQAQSSGLLDQVVGSLVAGKAAAPVQRAAYNMPPAAPELTEEAIQRMQGMNRF